MTTITVNVDETKWQFALDKANATALTAYNSVNKVKPSGSPFVPKTLIELVQARINDLTTNYANQAAASLNSVLLSADPASKARIVKILTASDEVKQQFAAQVDALTIPVAPTPTTPAA